MRGTPGVNEKDWKLFRSRIPDWQEAYAICFKSDGKAIGAIELKLNGHTDMTERDDECELGYWLAKPFWGR